MPFVGNVSSLSYFRRPAVCWFFNLLITDRSYSKRPRTSIDYAESRPKNGDTKIIMGTFSL